jgi:hypothetical protein
MLSDSPFVKCKPERHASANRWLPRPRLHRVQLGPCTERGSPQIHVGLEIYDGQAIEVDARHLCFRLVKTTQDGVLSTDLRQLEKLRL